MEQRLSRGFKCCTCHMTFPVETPHGDTGLSLQSAQVGLRQVSTPRVVAGTQREVEEVWGHWGQTDLGLNPTPAT